MTAAVGRVARGDVEVTVRRQEDGSLNPDEEQFFPPGEVATLREVCLSAHDMPLLIARTAFTWDILRSHPRIVDLGNKPLGSLLFEGGVPSPYTARQFCEIGESSPLFELIRWRHEGPEKSYWGRRTLFWLFDAPILVTEIFTPELIYGAHIAAAKATG